MAGVRLLIKEEHHDAQHSDWIGRRRDCYGRLDFQRVGYSRRLSWWWLRSTGLWRRPLWSTGLWRWPLWSAGLRPPGPLHGSPRLYVSRQSICLPSALRQAAVRLPSLCIPPPVLRAAVCLPPLCIPPPVLRAAVCLPPLRLSSPVLPTWVRILWRRPPCIRLRWLLLSSRVDSLGMALALGVLLSANDKTMVDQSALRHAVPESLVVAAGTRAPV